MPELTPKQRFQSDTGRKSRHVDLVRSADVVTSLETALAQMAIDAPSTESPAKAWDSHCQLEGAKKFIRIWMNLAEDVKPIERTPFAPNLQRDSLK